MIERWIEAPRLRLPEDETADRRATWLELFFDLVFAAAVADIGSRLSSDYTVIGLGRFGFQFFLIWWAWTGHTFFSTRFDNDDPLHRILTLAQMFLAAVMAVNANATLASREAGGFVAAYGGIRLLLAVQYGRVVAIPETARFARRQRLWLSMAAIAWLVSAVVPPTWRPAAWTLALALELGASLLARMVAPALPLDPAHLIERFGLFTLILFGQSVVAIMAGMRQRDAWTPGAATSAVLGLLLVFALWWAYFGGLAAANPKSPSPRLHVWTATHLSLCFAIAVAAVGIEHIIARNGSAPLGLAGPLLVGGVAGVVLTLGILVVAAPGASTGRAGQTLGAYAGLCLLLVPAALIGSAFAAVWTLSWLLGCTLAVNVFASHQRSQRAGNDSHLVGNLSRRSDLAELE